MGKNTFLNLCLLVLLVLPAACKEEKAVEIKSDDPIAMRAILPGEEKLPYHASSDVEGWQLSITADQIMLERPEKSANIILPKPEMELLTGGYKYRLATTPKVTTIEIKHVACKDGSGNSFADTVEIDDASGKTTGCGAPVGQPLPEAAPAQPVAGEQKLENIVWHATRINDTAVPEDVKITMELDGKGRLAGRGGCNGYSGPYELADKDQLVLGGGIVSTKMACMGAAGELEQSYFDALSQVKTYRFGQDGALVLTDKDGKDVLQFTP